MLASHHSSAPATNCPSRWQPFQQQRLSFATEPTVSSSLRSNQDMFRDVLLQFSVFICDHVERKVVIDEWLWNDPLSIEVGRSNSPPLWPIFSYRILPMLRITCSLPSQPLKKIIAGKRQQITTPPSNIAYHLSSPLVSWSFFFTIKVLILHCDNKKLSTTSTTTITLYTGVIISNQQHVCCCQTCCWYN